MMSLQKVPVTHLMNIAFGNQTKSTGTYKCFPSPVIAKASLNMSEGFDRHSSKLAKVQLFLRVALKGATAKDGKGISLAHSKDSVGATSPER